MKLSKTKKIILLGAIIGVLTTVVVTPIVIFNNKDNNQNNDQEKQNQQDVENIIKILEDKTESERTLIFASNLTGKIIADNQSKIVEKIKTLIGATNLKEAKIEIFIKKNKNISPALDKNISPTLEEIQIKVSKGKYSKTLDSKKTYFVKREQNQQEIIADVNSVKIALTSLGTKTLELEAKDDDKSINANKEAILNTLKEIKGYSDINFKEVEIKVKSDSRILPLNNDSPIDIVFVLSKGDAYSTEVSGFSAKQLDNDQVVSIKNELNQIKSSLESLGLKEVEVYAPSNNKTITHNKAGIKSAIENLNGYNAISDNFNGASLEVKNSDALLPTNEQDAIDIILVLLKNNVKVEVNGFSAKQTISTQNKINQIKLKITDKDILIAPNVSTQNQIEIEDAIKNQLQKENPALTSSDLLKISTNLSSLDVGVKTSVVLTFRIDSMSSTLRIDVEKANLLKGSSIVNGSGGAIFQDSFKNLWAMSSSITRDIDGNRKTVHAKLQVLKANQNKDGYVTSWTNNNGENGEPLLKGSNITNGQDGTIFQDEFKNLWVMGPGTSLQVLRANDQKNGYDDTGWTNDNKSGLLKGSNIINGENGKIFQDEFKNLWILGRDTRLQVLRANDQKDGYDENNGWTNDTSSGLLKASNIINGQDGTIFQDEFQNLWAMGRNTSLQVLEVNDQKDGYDESTGWTNAKNRGLLLRSNIEYGAYGTIFQDEFKNLWTMGYDKKLQVLRANNAKNGYVTTGWDSNNLNSATGLTKGSNITKGREGKIFQDEFKNLWTLGNDKRLQVLRVNSSGNNYVNTGWSDAVNNGLTKNSNVLYGQNGIIFQDKFKNLWVMARDATFQVLKVNSQKNGYDENIGWKNASDSGLLKGSKITNGQDGTIFQDQFDNLWAMGYREIKIIKGEQKIIYTKLQVLKANVTKDGYVDSWQRPID